MDLGYAGAGDVMLIDLRDPIYADPDFISRMRFVSRSAFPILGVVSQDQGDLNRFLRAGISEVLIRETLTPYLLDRAVRHWVKFQRLQIRLFEANRRALQWWKDLVSALDEIRHRMEKGTDSLEAYLTLLETGEGEVPSLRRRIVGNARKQVAEISELAQELDVAARTIQLEGIEKTKQQPRRTRGALFTAESLVEAALDEERNRSIDPSPTRDTHGGQRYGT